MKRLVVGLTVSIVLLVIGSGAACGYVYSDYQWTNYGGHQYALTMDRGHWTDAQAEAVALGGHLAAVNDAAENAFLASDFKGVYAWAWDGSDWIDYDGNPWASWVWIGYNWSDAQWRWSSGEPVTYAATWWDTPYKSPTFDGDSSEYAYLHTDTHPTARTWWNGAHDFSYARGVIEIVPEPSTFALLSVGVIGLLAYAWRRRAS